MKKLFILLRIFFIPYTFLYSWLMSIIDKLPFWLYVSIGLWLTIISIIYLCFVVLTFINLKDNKEEIK